MKTLILSSSFTTYETDAHDNRKARIIDNDNGFLDNLKKYLTSKNVWSSFLEIQLKKEMVPQIQ